MIKETKYLGWFGCVFKHAKEIEISEIISVMLSCSIFNFQAIFKEH